MRRLMMTTLGRRRFLELTSLAVAAWTLDARTVFAQKDGAVPSEVAASLMLRLTYRVRDVDATARFWSTLGATSTVVNGVRTMSLGGVQVALVQGNPSASSDGSVVNHIAFRVPNFDALQPALMAAGLRVERPTQFPGTLNAFTPEGDKVEIFDNNSTSPGFKLPEGAAAAAAGTGVDAKAAWQRHNAPVTALAGHHLHFYVPAGQEEAARQWYLERFGGVAGIRLRYAAIDFPGINLNFSTATPPAAQAATAGRSLDRIGFVVRGIDDLCRHITALGTAFTSPLTKGADGVSRAVITDPWGTTVEVSAN